MTNTLKSFLNFIGWIILYTLIVVSVMGIGYYYQDCGQRGCNKLHCEKGEPTYLSNSTIKCVCLEHAK